MVLGVVVGLGFSLGLRLRLGLGLGVRFLRRMSGTPCTHCASRMEYSCPVWTIRG